jgi:hypothetical protein
LARKTWRDNACALGGKGELIDHIVVSKGLVFVGADFIVKEVRSFVGLIEGQSVTANPNERGASVPPDHAQVLARFELPMLSTAFLGLLEQVK